MTEQHLRHASSREHVMVTCLLNCLCSTICDKSSIQDVIIGIVLLLYWHLREVRRRILPGWRPARPASQCTPGWFSTPARHGDLSRLEHANASALTSL